MKPTFLKVGDIYFENIVLSRLYASLIAQINDEFARRDWPETKNGFNGGTQSDLNLCVAARPLTPAAIFTLATADMAEGQCIYYNRTGDRAHQNCPNQ